MGHNIETAFIMVIQIAPCFFASMLAYAYLLGPRPPLDCSRVSCTNTRISGFLYLCLHPYIGLIRIVGTLKIIFSFLTKVTGFFSVRKKGRTFFTHFWFEPNLCSGMFDHVYVHILFSLSLSLLFPLVYSRDCLISLII